MQQVATHYPQQVATLGAIHPDTLAALQQTPTPPSAIAQAVGQISTAFHIGPAQAGARLAQAAALPASAKATLAHAPAVIKAKGEAPQQWKNWYWICFGATIFFLFTVPLMRGRWSPKAAKADEDAHEAMVQAEMEKLGVSA